MIIGEFLLQISSKNNAANITEVFQKSHRKFTHFGPQKLEKNPAKLLFYAKSCVFFKGVLLCSFTKS